jgi:DNA-binding transcriptional LysR family regulator
MALSGGSVRSSRKRRPGGPEGIGIGSLPCILARPDPELERVPAGAPAELDEVWLVVHPDVQRTGRVRAVIEALEKRMAETAADLSGSEG